MFQVFVITSKLICLKKTLPYGYCYINMTSTNPNANKEILILVFFVYVLTYMCKIWGPQNSKNHSDLITFHAIFLRLSIRVWTSH